MKLKRPFFILIILAMTLGFVSCTIPTFDDGIRKNTADSEESYNGCIIFDGRRYTYSGETEGVRADGDRLIIKKRGVYLISGRLTEGRIEIDCMGDVHIVLDGFEGSSSYGAVIERKDGGELSLSATKGSANVLTSSYEATDSETPTGCISVRGRLCLLGEGRLTVNAGKGSGIVCTDLYATGGELSVSCAKNGIFVSNSLKMTGGEVTVTYSKIGICAGAGEYSEGSVELLGGSVTAVCKEIGILHSGKLTVQEENVDIHAPCFSLSEKKQDI